MVDSHMISLGIVLVSQKVDLKPKFSDLFCSDVMKVAGSLNGHHELRLQKNVKTNINDTNGEHRAWGKRTSLWPLAQKTAHGIGMPEAAKDASCFSRQVPLP